jgi:hypothetical protein
MHEESAQLVRGAFCALVPWIAVSTTNELIKTGKKAAYDKILQPSGVLHHLSLMVLVDEADPGLVL